MSLMSSGFNIKCFDRSGEELDVSTYQLADEITNEIFLILDERLWGYEEKRKGFI